MCSASSRATPAPASTKETAATARQRRRFGARDPFASRACKADGEQQWRRPHERDRGRDCRRRARARTGRPAAPAMPHAAQAAAREPAARRRGGGHSTTRRRQRARADRDAGAHEPGAPRAAAASPRASSSSPESRSRSCRQKAHADEDERGRGAGGMQQRHRRRAIERDGEHRHDEGRSSRASTCRRPIAGSTSNDSGGERDEEAAATTDGQVDAGGRLPAAPSQTKASTAERHGA